jgi:hypothetical protein
MKVLPQSLSDVVALHEFAGEVIHFSELNG